MGEGRDLGTAHASGEAAAVGEGCDRAGRPRQRGPHRPRHGGGRCPCCGRRSVRLPGDDRGRVGVDLEPLRRLPGLHGSPLPGVLRGVLRLSLFRAAGRLVGDLRQDRHAYVSQLGLSAAPPDLRRHPSGERRGMTEVAIASYLDQADERRLANDVLDGLTRPFKELPPKHFYDASGAELFEQICELPEYSPTRTERRILEDRAEEIVRLTRAGELVELGSGAADKARILLAAMETAGTLRRFGPLDVARPVA